MTVPTPPRIVTTEVDDEHEHLNDIPSSDSAHSTPSRDQVSYLAPSPGGGIMVPPSPTLTGSSSIKFDDGASPSSPYPPSPQALTSLALRDNHPNALSGRDTLQVIGENDGSRAGLGLSPGHPGGHRRLSSVATWSTVEFDDEGNRRPAFPPLPQEEDEKVPKGYREKRAKKKQIKEEAKEEKARLKEEARQQSAHIDPDKDTTDPAPFKEKPSRLAMLVDPKSLEELEKMGGVQGLLEGLGVDPKKGLPTASHGHDEEKGAPRSGSAMPGGNGGQWTAQLEHRQEVYGKNELPGRKSKNIFQLMWIALKDKVLVSLFMPSTPVCWPPRPPKGCQLITRSCFSSLQPSP